MHLLEMAKTSWNANVASSGTGNQSKRVSTKTLLFLSQRVLDVYGPEGDDDGPLSEIRVLQALLDGDK